MQGFKGLRIPLLLVATYVWLSIAPLHAQGLPNGAPNDPLLDTLNSEFRAEYQQALASTLTQDGPVILEEGDDLILLHHHERTSVRVKPVEYHELKAVAHIPLALYVLLSFPQEARISGDRLQRLQRYRELMTSAYDSLPGRHFTADQLQRQEGIFRASFELLDGVLAEGQVSPPWKASRGKWGRCFSLMLRTRRRSRCAACTRRRRPGRNSLPRRSGMHCMW